MWWIWIVLTRMSFGMPYFLSLRISKIFPMPWVFLKWLINLASTRSVSVAGSIYDLVSCLHDNSCVCKERKRMENGLIDYFLTFCGWWMDGSGTFKVLAQLLDRDSMKALTGYLAIFLPRQDKICWLVVSPHLNPSSFHNISPET